MSRTVISCLLGRMPEHVSILQLGGVAFLVLAAVAWVVGLTRLLRQVRSRPATGTGPRAAAARTGTRLLAALPEQRRSAPELESVELTPAEQDAFAGLVRQLGHGH
ncbi:hypothetical protein SUDANB105_04288 [Streptomyces sp. enrichment culture]